MKAIILAAGKGSRLAPLTEHIPKPMIDIEGKPLLFYILKNLPDEIDEVIIITKHKGEVIKSYFGNRFEGKSVKYIDQTDKMSGTYAAVYSTKEYLQSGNVKDFEESFLVLGADDIFSKKELENVIKNNLVICYSISLLPEPDYLMLSIDENKFVRGMRRAVGDELLKPWPIATGVYVLDNSFWNLEPKSFGSDVKREYGIPQTLLPHLSKQNFQAVEIQDWMQVNNFEQLNKIKLKYKNML